MTVGRPRGIASDTEHHQIVAAVPTFGRYEVLGLLSHGHDLDVFDVWCPIRRTRAVLKTVRADRLEDHDVCDRLRDEAELLLRLVHPHIVRAYEWGNHPQPFLVEETLTGHTLGGLLERRGRLSGPELFHLADHVSAALAYLHDAGVLHLDLKPSNVVAEAGRAKLIDFSLAHAPGNGPRGWGTRRYLSPEQTTGGPFTTKTDIWGIGLLLCEAAAGRCPLPDPSSGDGSAETTRSSGSPDAGAVVPAPDLTALRARRRLPASFRRLVTCCLAIDPADRPTVEEFREVITPLLGAR